jgi:hypothetical protein
MAHSQQFGVNWAIKPHAFYSTWPRRIGLCLITVALVLAIHTIAIAPISGMLDAQLGDLTSGQTAINNAKPTFHAMSECTSDNGRVALLTHPHSGLWSAFSYGKTRSAPNAWNVKNSSPSSSVEECEDEQGMYTAVRLSDVSYLSRGPAGYAEIDYGSDLANEPFLASGPEGGFPLSVSTFIREHAVGTASYSVTAVNPKNAPFDVAYDLWIRKTQSNGHVKPGTAPGSQDLEIMIDFLNNGLRPISPLSTLAETFLDPFSQFFSSTPTDFSLPISINSATSKSTWLSYTGSGGTRAKLITFLLQDPSPLATATIKVSLSTFVQQALKEADLGSLDRYDIMGIDFGTEYDSSVLGPETLSLEWNLTRLDISSAAGSINLLPG